MDLHQQIKEAEHEYQEKRSRGRALRRQARARQTSMPVKAPDMSHPAAAL